METQTQSIEKVAREVGQMSVNVGSIVIREQGSYDRAVLLLGAVKGMQRHEDILKLEEAKDKAHQAHKSICELLDKVLDPLRAMEKVLKDKILAFDRAKQAEEDQKRRAAEEKDRKEREAKEREIKAAADREAKARAEAIRKEAEKKAKEAETKKEATRILAEAEQAAQDVRDAVQLQAQDRIAEVHAAPLPAVAPTLERSSAANVRDNWKAEITDFLAFARWATEQGEVYLLEPERLAASHPALDKVAKSSKGMRKIPGVRFENAGSVAAKALQ